MVSTIVVHFVVPTDFVHFDHTYVHFSFMVVQPSLVAPAHVARLEYAQGVRGTMLLARCGDAGFDLRSLSSGDGAGVIMSSAQVVWAMIGVLLGI